MISGNFPDKMLMSKSHLFFGSVGNEARCQSKYLKNSSSTRVEHPYYAVEGLSKAE